MAMRWGQLAATADDGRTVAGDVELARSTPRRMRGLLGRSHLAEDAAMWIEPTGSVHTCFMAFPIDVVFLDREYRVLKVVPELAPWRVAAARHAYVAVELPAGAAARRGLRPGERLALRLRVALAG